MMAWLASQRAQLLMALLFVYTLGRSLWIFDARSADSYFSFGKCGMPWSDALGNWSVPALNLVDGLGLALEPGGLSARSPGMALYVGMYFEAFGFKPLAVCAGNTVLLALLVPLLFMLALKLFRSEWVALLAVTPLLLRPELLPWTYAWSVMTEAPLMLIFVAFLLSAIAGVSSVPLATVAGLLLGFSMAIKPTAVFLGILPPLLFANAAGPFREKAKKIAAFAGGCAIWLLPLMFRSFLAYGDVNIVGTANLIAATESTQLQRYSEEQIFARAGYVLALDGEAALRRTLKPNVSVLADPPGAIKRLAKYLLAREINGFAQAALPPLLALTCVLVAFVALRRQMAELRSRLRVDALAFTMAAIVLYALAASLHPMYISRYALPFHFVELAVLLGLTAAAAAVVMGRGPYLSPLGTDIERRGDGGLMWGASAFFGVATIFALLFFARYLKMAPSNLECSTPVAPTLSVARGDEFAGTLHDLEYQVALQEGSFSGLNGRRVRWSGVVEPIAIVAADDSLKGRIVATLPYARVLAFFRGDEGACFASKRIWLDIPGPLGGSISMARFPAEIEGIIEPYEASKHYERLRIRATRIRKIAGDEGSAAESR